jgi:hypothetical protein
MIKLDHITNLDRWTVMRDEIMICCKANCLPNTDEIYLALLFRTDEELVQMCHELHIKVPPRDYVSRADDSVGVVCSQAEASLS